MFGYTLYLEEDFDKTNLNVLNLFVILLMVEEHDQ
jgi:hypothetical protein